VLTGRKFKWEKEAKDPATGAGAAYVNDDAW
jgi:hypothetical protein